MFKIMKNPARYYDYFKWQKYYSYQSPVEGAFTIELCDLCAVLNDRLKSKKFSMFPDIVNWWNGKYSYNRTTTEAPIEDL